MYCCSNKTSTHAAPKNTENTHTHTNIYIHTYVHTYVHTYIHTYIHTYYTYIHTHTHTYTYVLIRWHNTSPEASFKLSTRVFALQPICSYTKCSAPANMFTYKKLCCSHYVHIQTSFAPANMAIHKKALR